MPAGVSKFLTNSDRLQNLKFFVGAGLIADKNGAISRMVQNQQAPFAPASQGSLPSRADSGPGCSGADGWTYSPSSGLLRSEEHTSELQSLRHLVCRLLL